MEKNQNNDSRNQGNTDNKSNQKTNHNYEKKETDPNNPVANKDKQNDNEKKDRITNQDSSITNQDKAKSWFNSSSQRDEEMGADVDEETPIDKIDSNRKYDVNNSQNDIKSTNQTKNK